MSAFAALGRGVVLLSDFPRTGARCGRSLIPALRRNIPRSSGAVVAHKYPTNAPARPKSCIMGAYPPTPPIPPPYPQDIFFIYLGPLGDRGGIPLYPSIMDTQGPFCALCRPLLCHSCDVALQHTFFKKMGGDTLPPLNPISYLDILLRKMPHSETD